MLFLSFGWGKSPPTPGTRHDVAIVAVPCYPLYVPPRYAHPLAQGGMLALFVRKSVSEKRPFMLNAFLAVRM